MTEQHGLIHNGTHNSVSMEQVLDGTCIFGSRFIYELERAVHGTRKKHRLVDQNYCDKSSSNIVTKAAKIQRFS